MVNESEPDRRPGLEQPSGGSFAVNGVSVLPSAESLPIRGAVEADGSRYTAGEVNGDDRVNVRRKRGRPPKGGRVAKAVAAPVAKRIKKEEEDVCFICFDGGSLVLCDRRDCPKAYHPACVKRDEAFFTPRLRWNCGWHLCNTCQRNALFMCYTCPYSLCKTCVKQADISCVRGNKGFCKTCMSTISLIENIKQGNNQVGHIDFDDTTSWEYLFKVYWVYLKQKESLTLDELTRATNPWKGHVLNHVNNHVELSRTTAPLETNNNQVETNICRRRKTRKQLPMQNNSFERIVTYKLQENDVEWASKELLEFVAFVKNGDTSKLTQFDVRALLLEYIRKNKLRDPRRKCQIICDKRLEVLFGKARLAHFEMLKLLEYHFKDGSCASSVVRAAAIDSPSSEMKFEERSEESNIFARERKRHARKKVDERERHIKFDNYAAINVHNMSLIYLRRSLMENLLEDLEKFHDKVVGSIVRIRIVDNDLKQEMYRLVQVVDTGKAPEPYKIGDKTAHVILKILNLDKIEDVRIDAISNQDLSEDECIRLQQNITCGLVERMTVGEVHKKAIALQEVRIKDVIETEILKLNHLRDRASELGHRKELRECVEKLELLKSPEERLRRMHEIPEVHADPRMDSMYQSDEDSEQSATKQDVSMTPIHSISNSSVEPIARSSSSNWDLKRNVSDRPQINKEDDAARSLESSQSTLELEKDAARILEELRNQVDPCRITSKHEVRTLVNHPRDASDASVTSSSRSVPRYNTEHEKIWHYRDPSGKAQGPFCMQVLRKWNSDGYFPADLRIWRMGESQDKSLLLTDALLNQCNEDQFQSECLDPPEARFVSGCRSPEHGGQLSININTAWTNEKPHDGCVSDSIDAGKCSDDKGQPITGPNSRQGADLDYSSQVSPVANHNSSHVVTCPGGEVSNASLAVRDTVSRIVDQNHKSSPVASGEVSNACLAMRDTVIQTMDQNHKSDLVASSPGEEVPIACLASTDTVFQTVEQNYEPDCSNLPSLMPNGGSEDPKCLDTEAVQKVSASNVSSHMSGSSLGLSCGGLEFPNPSISTIKREPDHATLKGQEENKTAGDVRCEAEEHNQPVPSIVLEQNLGSDRKTTNFSDLPSQKLELNEGTKSDVVEFKEPVASYMQGQDSFTNWHALSSGIGFSVPVSSANQNSEGLKGLATELSLSSNATCHDIGFSWSSAAPLAGVTGPWPSRSMPTKSSVVELDSDIKFSDDATTTTGSCQFTHSLTTLLDCNTSIWHDGPIELSTLGDESVSDLLSEVEAMESLHGLPSPNSGIDFGDDPIGSLGNDCFSPLVGLSLPLMAGKHDTWSSTCDIQFRPQPTITDSQPSHSLHLHECPTNPLREDVRVKQELASSTQQDFLSLTCTPLATNPVCFGISLPMHHSPPGVDSHGHHHPPTSLSLSTMDPCRGPKPEKLHDDISNSNSLNLGFVSLHHSPEPSLTPPAIPNTSSQMGVAAAAPSQQQIVHPDVTASSPAEEGEVEAAAPAAAAASLSLQLSVNVLAAPPHHSPKDPARRKISGFGEEGKPSSRATGCGNRASQHPRLHGAGGGRRYHQNIDPGPGFLKPARPPWSRQSSFNSSAGGYSRQPHRGQRVCKFYESGYCKKGASCNYLHP